MYTTPQPVTWALSLMNISPSLTKSQHFLNPAILLFVHFFVSVLTSITKKTASTIATSIVHSKLDYCNSFYHNLPNSQLHRLQLIQNSLACTVFNAPKILSHHSSPIVSLHWLKIKERIEYKLRSLTHKILTTSQATYLHNLVSPQSPRGSRSSSIATLSRPESRNARNLVS